MIIDRAVIEVNGGCNYSCSMCPQDTRTGGRHKDFLKKMTLKEFENNVADCAQHGLRIVNLDGSGSTVMIYRGIILNKLSDLIERRIGSYIYLKKP